MTTDDIYCILEKLGIQYNKHTIELLCTKLNGDSVTDIDVDTLTLYCKEREERLEKFQLECEKWLHKRWAFSVIISCIACLTSLIVLVLQLTL